MNETDIREYTDKKSKPILRKDKAVTVNLPTKGEIIPGYRGPIPAREEYGLVQFCDRRDHFLKKLEAYSLSEPTIRKLKSVGIRRLLIAEEDTNMVWEFRLSQFDEQVPKQYNPNHDVEPQRYVPIEQNRGKWPDHTSYVMMGERTVK